MPKVKKATPKVKKKATKYSKLMAVAEKELAGKRKALISAERALQKAKVRHEELIAEVARLDMVGRSLKALVEGTEPPTNVKYVYNYPQWVWAPSVYQPGYYTQPQWTFTNTPNMPGYTITCQNSNLPLQGHNSNGVLNGGTGNFNVSTSGGILTTTQATGMYTTNSASVETGVSCIGSGGGVETHYQDGSVMVDLSTHADLTDEPAEKEYLEATATVSNS